MFFLVFKDLLDVDLGFVYVGILKMFYEVFKKGGWCLLKLVLKSVLIEKFFVEFILFWVGIVFVIWVLVVFGNWFSLFLVCGNLVKSKVKGYYEKIIRWKY